MLRYSVERDSKSEKDDVCGKNSENSTFFLNSKFKIFVNKKEIQFMDIPDVCDMRHSCYRAQIPHLDPKRQCQHDFRLILPPES